MRVFLRRAERLGLVSMSFLWQRCQARLLQDMVDSGLHAVLIKVATIGAVVPAGICWLPLFCVCGPGTCCRYYASRLAACALGSCTQVWADGT